MSPLYSHFSGGARRQKRPAWISFVLVFSLIFSSTPTIAEGKVASKKASVRVSSAKKLIQSHQSFTLPPDGTAEFEVGFKNTGTNAWVPSQNNPLLLRSKVTRESYFYDKAHWVSRVVASAKTDRVNPGRLVFFKILLHAPLTPGRYTEEMYLVLDGREVRASRFLIPITVETGNPVQARAVQAAEKPLSPAGQISAIKLIQSNSHLTMPALGRVAFEIGYKNTGTDAWPASGPDALTVRSLAKKESYFYDPSWTTGTAVKTLAGAAPGELVYAHFLLYAPQKPGSYIERLALYHGSKQIPGTEVSILIAVTEGTPRTTLAVHTPASTPSPAQAVTPPQSLGALEAHMGSAPIDASSSTLAARALFVPQGIVDDKTDVEKSIRVGITHSNDPILITASKDYEVRDTTGVLLGAQISGAPTTVIYNRATQLYAVTLQQGSFTTRHPLKFVGSQTQTARVEGVRAATLEIATSSPSLPPAVPPQAPSTENTRAANTTPDQDTVFEILSFSNRPGWSTALNDNKFRAMLEVRYTPATDRIWIINELMLEQYLKGIAETSNASPYEYQKALLIAARTYAVYHIRRSTKYASENFTVRTTDADQVYRGYNAEIRLPNVSRAIEETRGVIVTYQGQLAITPYYSQSDGRTRSWEEVWAGGGYPWLKSVPDPSNAGLKMLGHGVGMSARGALLMALSGKGFEEILKYYYSGVELRRIY